ncbi:hypothetical protein ACFL9T_11045 [Thermodesulfobacteriota bacterium]
MENDPAGEIKPANEVLDEFNQILYRHLERLIGTSYGIGALPLNLETISFLILLTEQENNEIEALSMSSERYKEDTLIQELIDMGFTSEDLLDRSLEEMIQKNYVEVDPDGRLSAKESTVSMARLLDYVFPTMPGMNFTAYSAQILSEVQTGRKNFELGLRQFDQTLEMQGAAIKQPKSQPKADSTPVKPKKMLQEMALPKSFYAQIAAQYKENDKSIATTDFEDARSAPDHGQTSSVENDQKFSQQPEELETPIEEEHGEADRQYAAQEILGDQEAERSVIEEKGDFDFAAPEESSPSSIETEGFDTTPQCGITAEHGNQMQGDADEEIEKRITSFEEDLAMQCPICRTGAIYSKETATGKSYFKCSAKDCIFISWGKPHHIACPSCQNPFLIEAKIRGGEPILKCPRATCRYRQDSPGDAPSTIKTPTPEQMPGKKKVLVRRPKRKVKMRRVVRRTRNPAD